MANNRLLLVMPYRDHARKAVAAGFRVYSICDPARQRPGDLAELRAHSAELVHTDLGDAAGLRRVVTGTARRHRVARVVAMGWEDTHLPAAAAARELGIALNPPEVLARIDDKAAMRETLQDWGRPEVWSARAESPEHARELLGWLDLPVVAKPAGLSASRGVHLIRGADDVRAWSRRLDAYGYTGPVLLEEYLRGPEFSVETLTVDGVHHVVGVTAKDVTPGPEFVETGHRHPAALAEPDRAAVAAEATELLRASGYRFGPAHTEVVLTARGPRIVESQARLGGDRIPLLVELATGFDLEAAVFAALAGKPVETPIADRLGCVTYFRFAPGRLRSVRGLDELARLPFVREVDFPFEPGDVLPPTHDSRTRHGHVVYVAGSHPEAADHAAAVHDLLRVVTEPVEERRGP
jgi:biotin carboxylase